MNTSASVSTKRMGIIQEDRLNELRNASLEAFERANQAYIDLEENLVPNLTPEKKAQMSVNLIAAMAQATFAQAQVETIFSEFNR